jgi:hypothetical protein
MVVGVGFCKIKVDSNFLLVLKIKCTKFHQDRSKTVDLHTKYTNKQTFSFIYVYRLIEPLDYFSEIIFFMNHFNLIKSISKSTLDMSFISCFWIQ